MSSLDYNIMSQGEQKEVLQITPKAPVASKACTILTWVFAIIAILVAFILSGFLRKPLFDYGAQFIHSFQQPPSSAGKVIFNLIQLMGQIYIIGPIFGLVYLIIYRKLNGIVYLSFMIINIYLIAVTKQAYQDPRPFWQYKFVELLQWRCTNQYGYPSGHAWISILLFEPIISDFTGLGPFRWAIAAILFTGTLIPLSRLYLGVHSVDQILTGLVLSVSMLSLYRFGLQKQLFRYLHACLTMKKRKYLILAITIIANILVIIIPIIIFEVNTKSRLFDDKILADVNKLCQTSVTHYQLEKKHSQQGAVGNIFFGFIYGLMLTANFGDRNWWSSYYFGQWKYDKKKNVFFKLLLYILLAGLVAGIFVGLIPSFIKNFYGAYFSSVFGIILSGMIITFFVPYLAQKNKIIYKKGPHQIRTDRLTGAQINQKDSDELQKCSKKMHQVQTQNAMKP